MPNWHKLLRTPKKETVARTHTKHELAGDQQRVRGGPKHQRHHQAAPEEGQGLNLQNMHVLQYDLKHFQETAVIYIQFWARKFLKKMRIEAEEEWKDQVIIQILEGQMFHVFCFANFANPADFRHLQGGLGLQRVQPAHQPRAPGHQGQADNRGQKAKLNQTKLKQSKTCFPPNN